ncbi:hypothetical protein [Sphingomonas sp.]|uniref:hypothetical protein n=1 Tax=Sphingomonas sp. TaxID=28214 RepID=UPI0035C79F0D
MDLTARLAAAHAAVGQRFVSAQVLGRPDVAAAGKLSVIAAEDLDLAQHLFDVDRQLLLDPDLHVVTEERRYLVGSRRLPAALIGGTFQRSSTRKPPVGSRPTICLPPRQSRVVDRHARLARAVVGRGALPRRRSAFG